jgi:hypothetical protein
VNNVVVTNPPRADIEKVTKLGEYGVATVHEALGRTGYLGPDLRPVHLGSRIGGTAVTVLCWPGDNLMIHAAVEQCQPGDVLVEAGLTENGWVAVDPLTYQTPFLGVPLGVHHVPAPHREAQEVRRENADQEQDPLAPPALIQVAYPRQ